MKAKILSTVAAVLMIGVILVALPLTIPKLFGITIYNLLTPSPLWRWAVLCMRRPVRPKALNQAR